MVFLKKCLPKRKLFLYDKMIRRANILDAVIIALLARITFDETFGHLFKDRSVLLHYFDTTFSVDKIRKSLEKENNCYWLAFADRLPVGYAKLKLQSPCPFLTTTKISQLQKIYVLKDFLAQRIGHQLQEKLLQKAKNYGSKSIWLSVLKSNDRAINFYLKNDFSEIGEHPFEIGKYRFHFTAMCKTL